MYIKRNENDKFQQAVSYFIFNSRFLLEQILSILQLDVEIIFI